MSLYRFPGLRSFEESDTALFNGRSTEKQCLFDLIMVERVVVLFAKSGAGKTSLLRAGIVPMFANRPFQGVFIRLNDPKKPLREQVFAQIARVFGITAAPAQTLWEYLQTINGYTGNLTPVLFFDQFEEIFTLYDASAGRDNLIAELADVLNETLPATVRAHLQNQADPVPDDHRTALEKPPRAKMVFSIRSDQLSNLHELADQIPGILRNRYELKGLRREQASEAILNPAGMQDSQFQTPPFTFEPEALRDILDNLTPAAGQTAAAALEIESFQLQLVCSHIELQMVEQLRRGNLPLRVSIDTYGGKAGLERLLAGFYQDTIRQITDSRQQYHARRLIENELIKNERRVSVAEAAITGGEYPVSPATLHLLVDKRLLRREERPGMGNYFELAHDTLLTPVLQFKRERELQETAEKARQERDAETLKRRKVLALAIGFGILAVAATVASLYAKSQRDEARVQRQKAQINYLLAESKLQYASDRTLSFRLGAAAWSFDTAGAVAAGCMIHAFYGDLLPLGDSLFATPHYRAFDALWAKPVPGSNRVLLLLPDRLHLSVLDLGTGHIQTAAVTPEVSDAALSPSGETLVTIHSNSDTAWLWAWGKEHPLKLLIHEGKVNSVACSPDGRYFTTNSYDNTQRLWSTAGELLMKYPNRCNADLVVGAAFSPDGRQLLVGHDNTTARLYTLPGDRAFVPLSVGQGAITAAAFSGDGQSLVLVATDAENQRPPAVCVFDRQGRRLLRQGFSSPYAYINTAIPDADGRRIVMAISDSTVRVIDTDRKTMMVLGACTEQHQGIASKAVFSPDGTLLASGASDGSVRVWQQGRLLAWLPHSARLEDLFFSPDGKTLITTTEGQKVRWWSLYANPCRLLHTADIPVYAGFRPGGNAVWAKDFSHRWYAWSENGQPERAPDWLNNDVRYAVAGSKSNTALLQLATGELRLRNLLSGAETLVARRPVSNWPPAVSAQNGLIALCRADTAEVLRISGEMVTTLVFSGSAVNAIGWQPGGQTLAFALTDGTVRTWSVATGKLLTVFTLPVVANALAWGPDGKTILFGGTGHAFRWNGSDPEPEIWLPGRHEQGSALTALACSPDGKFIASAAFDGAVMLWDREGQWLHTFRLPERFGAALGLQFSSDGRHLLAQYDGQALVVWLLYPDQLLEALDRQQARPLLPEERRVYGLEQ